MNILLCCAAGMSTSLLVSKMEKYSNEVGNNDKIWAVSADHIENHIAEADILLLGPQVRYMLERFKKYKEEGIPVEVINSMDYGMCNGEAVVKYAYKFKNK